MYLKTKYEFSDFQILSVEMPQELQKEEESSQSQVDQGFPKKRWQGVGCGPVLRV